MENRENRPFELHSNYLPAGDQPTAIKILEASLNKGEMHQVLLGVTGSGKTFTMANLIKNTQRPTLILAHNKTLAAQLYGEMRGFFPNNAVEYFVSYYDYYQPEAYVPQSDTFIEKDASINEHIEQMRLSATKAILERSDTIIIATVSAIYGLGDPKTYLSMVLHLVNKDRISPKEIMYRLAKMQYQRNDIALLRGTFRVRGEIIDVFPAESEKEAIRIDLFDEQIESLSYFDPLTGKISHKAPRLTIYPKSHYVTPKEQVLNIIDQIKFDLAERLKILESQDKILEAARLKQRTFFDIEMMIELGYCTGIENYSRYLSGRSPGDPPPTLFDYLPKNALLIIDESHVTVPQLGAMYLGDRSRKENLVNYGFRLPSAMDNRPLKFEELLKLIPQTLYTSATPGTFEKEHASVIAEQIVRPTGLVDPVIEIRPAGTQVDNVMQEIQEIIKKGERLLITTLTKRMAEDLTDFLFEHGIKVRYLHSDIETVERIEIIRDLRLGVFDVLVGINLLREGLDMPEVSTVAIFDADKEGFLRSDRALIQTIGRAARHLNGRAILYADRITNSMQRAIDETNRRRQKQIAFNQAHGITPQSIKKSVEDIMEGALSKNAYSKNALREKSKNSRDDLPVGALTPAQAKQTIASLEKAMRLHAQNLEFEQAVKIRDQLLELREFFKL